MHFALSPGASMGGPMPTNEPVAASDAYTWPMAGMHAEAYAPPSPEHRFWLRVLKDFIAPRDGKGSLLSRAWGVFAVAPFAHITFFNLDYQAYLYDIFHTTKTARFGHQTCMPPNVFMMIVALMQFRAGPVNAGLVLAVVLTAWYVALAFQWGYKAWGLVMAALMGGIYALAVVYFDAFAYADLAPRPWYAPTTLAANPFVWMGVFSFLQALSHAPEPKLPPRVTGGPHWQSVAEYILGPAGRRNPPLRMAVNALRTALQSVYGTIDEWWAAPRLFNIGVLEQLWAHGYQREKFAAQDALVRRALDSGNPAVDYIGEGGGAYLRY